MLTQCKEIAKEKVGTEKVLTQFYAVYSTDTVEPKAIKLGIKTLAEAEIILESVPVERRAVVVKIETKARTIKRATK